jgi:hypothetical protein
MAQQVRTFEKSSSLKVNGHGERESETETSNITTQISIQRYLTYTNNISRTR